MRRLGLTPHVLLAALTTLGASGWTGAARADSPYTLELKLDLPVLAIGAGLTAMALIEVGPPACFPRCDPSGISALDRGALGNYSETAHTAASLAVAALLALPVVLGAIDVLDERGSGLFEDAIVYGETLLIAQALVQLTKFAVRRTAPFAYDPNAPADAVNGADASRSFISGHTTMAFAATTAYSVTYWQRNPDSPLRWLVLSLGAALSASIGVLKIIAGYHFVTDVLAGALIGAGVGALVPLLHVQD